MAHESVDARLATVVHELEELRDEADYDGEYAIGDKIDESLSALTAASRAAHQYSSGILLV